MYEPSPAWPHGPLTPIFEDLWFVMGTNRVPHAGVDLQTSRTMLVLRDAKELTLINSVRLDAAGLAELDALGTVKHVIRLGAFHGRDDPFYCDHYGAALWALPGSAHGDGRDADRVLEEPLPHGARVFVFRSAKYPEAALRLPHGGGTLVTCDAIQNWASADRFFSPETAAVFEAQGLIAPANIPSTWLGACAPARDDFERLLALDFKHLVTAHGEPLLDDAHARIAARVCAVFG
jgi:hypothetical protein